MKNLSCKKPLIILAAVFFVFAVSFFAVTSCRNPTSSSTPTPDIPDTPDGDTRLIVAIHDTPFKKDNKNVEKLNITVKEMVIIVKTMNGLAIRLKNL